MDLEINNYDMIYTIDNRNLLLIFNKLKYNL